MKDKANIIAMVPARIGSTRLKMKNLALINGKPLISYAVEAAKASGVFSRVVVNSDNEIFAGIAKRYGADFYLRPAELGSSTTKSDNVVYDFMAKHLSDIVAWVNPTSPLQTGDEIRSVINYFVEENLDTLITVKNEQVHCIFEGKPVNFNTSEIFAQTQDLKPVQPFVYSIMMWRSKTFIDTFDRQGYALFCGKIGYYPVSKETSIIIKTKEDIMLADYVMRVKSSAGEYEVKYDDIVGELVGR
jgi:CMP-N-acetylneuraminic acid synthetase